MGWRGRGGGRGWSGPWPGRGPFSYLPLGRDRDGYMVEEHVGGYITLSRL